MIRRGSAKIRHAKRDEWLRERFLLHAAVPGIDQDVTDANRPALDALHAEMRAAGLFGMVLADSQRETLRRLLTEIRNGRLPENSW